MSGSAHAVSPQRTNAGAYTQVAQGRYLARAGDCRACHTAEGGKPFSGGRAIPTPFGIIYSTNITPDPDTGIGKWSNADFYRAMHEGIGREDERLYPAFPYPSYTKVSREDVAALKAYLDTVEPVRSKARPNKLPWPLNMRTPVAIWDGLYFDEGTYRSDPGKSAQWNRGAYLVQGLGHCGACHTEKNFAGATDDDHPLQGGFGENAFAPSLGSGLRDGLGRWTEADIVQFLATGGNDRTSAAGPMAEVVEQSTQYLSKADLQAVAVYLKDLPGDENDGGEDDGKGIASDDRRMQRGAALYMDNCTGCHMQQGTGQHAAFPPLEQSPSVQAEHADTLVNVILNGAQKPATAADVTALRMPEFAEKLDDGEIADLVTYIRNAWGNRAASISGDQVADLRQATRHGGS